VILDKPHQLVLITQIGQQVQPDLLGEGVLQPVEEPFVVAVVEALLHQLPLQVPVRLGHEQEIRVVRSNGADDLAPVFAGRARSRPRTPGLFEDPGDEEHGHVTAHAVALAGDLAKRLDGGAPQPRVECVELQHVLPRREVRIAPARKDLAVRPVKLTGGAGKVGGGPADKIVRVRKDPRVVRGDVVWDKVQEQAQTPRGQRLSRRCQSLRSSQMRVDDIPPHAIRRAHHVVRREVGQGAAEFPL